MNRTTKRARVYGIVQGVGFRPTVSRHAMEYGVTGSVCNKGPYVEIFAQGEECQVNGFLSAVEHHPPKRAAILKVDTKAVENPTIYQDFSIVESEKTKGEIFVSPDIALCDECQKELYDPHDRRYLHPFINCTCCGPRLTILDALPYDRERTSMKEFPMCPDCAQEYHSPESRRYDAQPVCCNDCGPEVYLIHREERGRAAIIEARKTILRGGIVAVKGIGGFHLCCDATNQEAITLLRTRKRRPQKPFAVMMRNLEAVGRECLMETYQEEILTGHQKPILLLKRRENGLICEAVAPGNPKIGVMLPYAPVQCLLFDYNDGLVMPDALVMTSGNISGAPICRSDEDASTELGHLCDAMLSHNRTIRIRADDTVMDSFEGKPYMIRRSRGYAPLPFLTAQGFEGTVLAVGGELKNTFCIGTGDLFYPSPYVGDLADLRTVEALKETISRFETLLEVQPEAVVCDLHPKYNSTVIAQELGLPLVQVQHHYAHILSCMAENDCLEPCIGVSFDGTGYGTDGTIWGGELLACDLSGFQRLGSIAPFLQIGGDASAREGWRIAVSMIYGLTHDKAKTLEWTQKLELCGLPAANLQMMMYDRRLNAVTSTSAGRLFDGVSALLGIRKASTFEGEASTALQFAAERFAQTAEASGLVGMDECQLSERILLNTDRLVRDLLEQRLNGESPEKLAYLFHLGLSKMIVQSCVLARKQTGRNLAALSGGCFQNLLLLRLVKEGLAAAGFRVLTHSLVPPNDGGIALGQAVFGSAQRTNKTGTKN